MLSNAFAQNKDAASLVLTRAADMAKQLDIKLLVETEVHAINRTGKQLDTTSGTLEYDKLVLALGPTPFASRARRCRKRYAGERPRGLRKIAGGWGHIRTVDHGRRTHRLRIR
jgi:NAD(P)H-nitrite reductase large subunit